MDSSLSSITSVLNLSNSLKDVVQVLKLNQFTLDVERETSEQISAPTPPRSSFRPRVESTESGITSSTNTSPFTTTGAGQVMTGGWLSVTVTTIVQRRVLPAASVAWNTTLLLPNGKVDPLTKPLIRIAVPDVGAQLSVNVGFV